MIGSFIKIRFFRFVRSRFVRLSYVRISALLRAEILVAYTLFNMQTYLTDVLELDFTRAAGYLNITEGISMVLRVLFLFLVDAFCGNFQMLVLSSMAYSVGIGFLFLSTPPVLANSTGMCKQYESQCIGQTQKALLFTGLALCAVGKAGHFVSLRPFLEEQEERCDKDTIRTAKIQVVVYCFMVILPYVGVFLLLSFTVPWSMLFGIVAICTLVVMLLFLTGWREYTKIDPQGSPLTNVCRVFVASASKKSHSFPLDAEQLYKKDGEVLRRFNPTRTLRCLEKAAIILPGVSQEEQENNRWRLCSVAEIEEAKIAVRMVPMWMTFIICGIVSSIGNTYFVEQANRMNQQIGEWNVPLPIFLMLSKVAKDVFAYIYTKVANGIAIESRKYAPPTGFAIAMIFSVLCCITAAKIETRRLNVIRRHDLLDKPDEEIPMSAYWLLFQFFLLAGLDSFFKKSVAAFFHDQAPKSMIKYLDYFATGIFGLGYICSVLSVYAVGKISEKVGKTNWFQNTLNRSRLDSYYWVLAALSSVNLLLYIVVAFCYRYKSLESNDDEEGGNAEGESSPQFL